ncbi:MAG: aminotransferase class V-fold PLP-dependent enzyme [Gammaproteobacteria bacterium]|nr:aminotransferase class V-fold PLP-dependent enzyme [Gammaproteobacteria bacterium]
MKEQYYLDNASTTWPKPEPVYRFMDEFFRRCGVNPGRSGHELALEAEKMTVETRRLLAGFFGFPGDFERVIFTQNATDSLNIALYGLLRPGDHVVTTRTEHNSVLRPLHALESAGVIETTYVAHDDQGYVDPADIGAAVRADTRLVVVNHASNVLGALQDLAGIGRVVADTDALLVVDSCQSAGVVPVHCRDMHIDVLTFTGHKGLYGPMGIGGMIVAEGVDVKPLRVGGTGVDSNNPEQPDDYPHHLEAGTLNIPGIAGLNAAQKWFAGLGRSAADDPELDHAEACAAAMAAIHDREVALVRRLEDHCRATPGITVYGPAGDQPRVATLATGFDKVPSGRAGEMLDADYHLCVRPGLQCAPLIHRDAHTIDHGGLVRFSLGYFNDEEDTEQAMKAVTEIAEM